MSSECQRSLPVPLGPDQIVETVPNKEPHRSMKPGFAGDVPTDPASCWGSPGGHTAWQTSETAGTEAVTLLEARGAKIRDNRKGCGRGCTQIKGPQRPLCRSQKAFENKESSQSPAASSQLSSGSAPVCPMQAHAHSYTHPRMHACMHDSTHSTPQPMVLPYLVARTRQPLPLLPETLL